MKKTLISGIQPSGIPHIGNYFGMMKQLVDMQDEYQVYADIVDLHALTSLKSKEEIEANSLSVALDFLAIGLDPEKTVLFRQSSAPQVTELSWILGTLTSMPYLMRAHAFKDAEAKKKDINLGLFSYPVLMAADILILDTDVVPVGKDQQQHLEISRDLAEKFNNAYGDTFKKAKTIIRDEVAIIPGLDGEKMSKSLKNTIPLFSTEEEIRDLVMKIPTDSKGVEEKKNPDDVIVYQIQKPFLSKEEDMEVRGKYESGGLGYKEAKEMLIDTMSTFTKPLREKREELAKDMDGVRDLLKENGKKVYEQNEEKMKEVREKVGLL